MLTALYFVTDPFFVTCIDLLIFVMGSSLVSQSTPDFHGTCLQPFLVFFSVMHLPALHCVSRHPPSPPSASFYN